MCLEFSCEKDNDIENYLKNKAIDFEVRGVNRNYIIYNSKDIKPHIYGYFTLAIHNLIIPETAGLSKNMRKKLQGFSHSDKDDNYYKEFPSILIGQFGKNDKFKNRITGDELMNFCLFKVFEGQAILGSTSVILECKNIGYLRSFYEKFGFKYINDDYLENELIKFVKILDKNEIIIRNEL